MKIFVLLRIPAFSRKVLPAVLASVMALTASHVNAALPQDVLDQLDRLKNDVLNALGLGNESEEKEPGITIEVIGSAPSSNTDCQLPSTSDEVVDIVGVPNEDWIRSGVVFPQNFESTQKFKVSSTDTGLFVLSETQNGPKVKEVELTITDGSNKSSPFYIHGKNIGKAMIHSDEVTDVRKSGQTVTYQETDVPTVIWGVSDNQIVDYNALGDTDTNKYCYEDNPPSGTTPGTITLKQGMDDRINCGDKADFIAADATSLQLARLMSGGYGHACFTISNDSGLPADEHEARNGKFSDPVAGGSSTTSPATNVETIPYTSPDADYWAFGTYTPPSDFFKPEPNKVSRTVTVEFQFVPLNEDGSATRSHITAMTKEIEIRRPPVLFAHGLWSNAEVWLNEDRTKPSVWTPVDPPGWILDTKFQYDQPHPTNPDQPRASGPFTSSSNMQHVNEGITKLVDKSREEGIATTKVDIVAHSMGGLLSRAWMNYSSGATDNDNYRNGNNFYLGNVRKLITLHSPHYGTQIANMLIHIHRAFDHGTVFTSFLNSRLEGDIHYGAICQLAENSPALILNAVEDVRGKAHVGTKGDRGSLHAPLKYAGWLFGAFKTEHIDPFVFREPEDPNDGIVAEYSQFGGLTGLSDPNLLHSTNFSGGEAVTQSKISAEKVFDELDYSLNFTNGIPAGDSTGNGATRPGVADSINTAQDYQDECGVVGDRLFLRAP